MIFLLKERFFFAPFVTLTRSRCSLGRRLLRTTMLFASRKRPFGIRRVLKIAGIANFRKVWQPQHWPLCHVSQTTQSFYARQQLDMGPNLVSSKTRVFVSGFRSSKKFEVRTKVRELDIFDFS